MNIATILIQAYNPKTQLGNILPSSGLVKNIHSIIKHHTIFNIINYYSLYEVLVIYSPPPHKSRLYLLQFLQ